MTPPAPKSDTAAKPTAATVDKGSSQNKIVDAGKNIALDAGITKEKLSADLGKTFHNVQFSDKSFSADDFLKMTGCSADSACTVDTTKLSLGSGEFTVKKAADKDVHVKSGETVNNFQTAMSHSEWDDALKNIDQLSGSKLTVAKWDDSGNRVFEQQRLADVLSGKTEKCADGYIHRNSKGEIDFEVHGNVESKHNADGTISERDTKTGDVTLKNPDGSNVFTLQKDGTFRGRTPSGKEIEIDPKTGVARDVNTGETSDIKDGEFQGVVDGKKVSISEKPSLPGASGLLANAQALLNGKADIALIQDAAFVKGPDGLMMFAKADGSAGISIDKNSTMIRDAQGNLSIHYTDGRVVPITKEQAAAMYKKDGKDVKAIMEIIDKLRLYATTGKLLDGHGGVITKSQNNHMSARSQGVEARATGNGTADVKSDHTGRVQSVNLILKTDTLKTPDGKVDGVLDFKGPKTTFDTNQFKYNGDSVVTNDGTKYSSNQIDFADGTKFNTDNTITDNRGETFDTKGESISGGKQSNSASEETATNKENNEKANISRAEGMAASIMGRAAGGHATLGDIQMLQSSMNELSALVGSLAQYSSPSLMAVAMIAKGEIAASLEVARSSFQQDNENKQNTASLAAQQMSASHSFSPQAA